MSLNIIVLAAGAGTRMCSDLPKVLHQIAGKAMISHVLETALELSPDNISLVYGFGGEKVKGHVNENCDSKVISFYYQEEQLGTGHAVMQVRDDIQDSQVVLIMYADVPLIKQQTLSLLIERASLGKLALLTAHYDKPGGYGRIIRDKGAVTAIVEEKDATEEEKLIKEVNTGVMAIAGVQLKKWLSQLTKNNAQKEYYLTDIIQLAVEDGIDVDTINPTSEEEVYGVNTLVQLAYAERVWQRWQAERLMQSGVMLYDPARFDLRGQITCGKGVKIDIGVVIEGQCILGDDVIIGAYSTLKDAIIEDGVNISSHSVIEGAVIGSDSVIGPFARLRPDTKLEGNVKVGNFVEIKKTVVEKGSKINHLSYIGDSRLGENVNIGAGTITCNYDGANKHMTTIGNDVFVGSDTQIVAPVTIGDGATIGAGSTITKDVPSESLTLSRSKQFSRAGWRRPIKIKKAKK